MTGLHYDCIGIVDCDMIMDCTGIALGWRFLLVMADWCSWGLLLDWIGLCWDIAVAATWGEGCGIRCWVVEHPGLPMPCDLGIRAQWKNADGPGTPVWFYILRPFPFFDCRSILGLRTDCKRIVDCGPSGALE